MRMARPAAAMMPTGPAVFCGTPAAVLLDVLEALELPLSVAVASVSEPELGSGFVRDSVTKVVSGSLVLCTVVRVLMIAEPSEVTVVRTALPVWCGPVPAAVVTELVMKADAPVKVVCPTVV